MTFWMLLTIVASVAGGVVAAALVAWNRHVARARSQDPQNIYPLW